MYKKFIEIIKELHKFTKISYKLHKLSPVLDFDIHKKFLEISNNVTCAHHPSDILYFVYELLRIAPFLDGNIAEVGAYTEVVLVNLV